MGGATLAQLWISGYMLLLHIFGRGKHRLIRKRNHVFPALQTANCAQSCLFVTLWTVCCQAPPSMGLSRQEHWTGLPLSPPGDLPDPGIKPCAAGRFFTSEPSGKPIYLDNQQEG